ncbi:MAG: anthranilate synthase component I [Vallitalea sp.]|nr:anthranilate synthase component I [Vallitalea sp.]
MKKIKLIPYVKQLSGDMETPITLYQKYVGESIGILLESNEQPKGRYSFIAKDPFAIIKTKGSMAVIETKGKIQIKEGKALDIVKEYLQQYDVKNNTSIPFIGGAVGTVSYDVIRQYENLPDENEDVLQLPDVHQMFIKELIAFDHMYQKINLIILEEDNEKGKKEAEIKLAKMQKQLSTNEFKIDNYNESNEKEEKCIRSNMDKKTYMDIVEKAKKYIYEGDIFQVVLSQRWKVKTNEKPFKLYRKLRQVNPSAYLFYLNYGDYQVAGSSPEMLVELRKDKIYTCPIAGTRKRGSNEEEDKVLTQDLLNDEKEQSEHVMLVDLGRNDMGRVANIGTVNVSKMMEVRYYSHVMHLVSLVEGQKTEQEDSFSVLSTFLPAGTLSGAPKIRAMEIIEELEPSKRGIYGGAVGYFGFDGDMDMCIAIRTMVINDESVYVQAGAGIVADSNPEKEYEETLNKAKALLRAIQ